MSRVTVPSIKLCLLKLRAPLQLPVATVIYVAVEDADNNDQELIHAIPSLVDLLLSPGAVYRYLPPLTHTQQGEQGKVEATQQQPQQTDGLQGNMPGADGTGHSKPMTALQPVFLDDDDPEYGPTGKEPQAWHSPTALQPQPDPSRQHGYSDSSDSYPPIDIRSGFNAKEKAPNGL